MRIKRYIQILLLALVLPIAASAHSFSGHRADFYDVLPFDQNKALDKWMKYISYELLDNYRGISREEYGGLSFYEYLKQNFPPFKCSHRLLFHWGYNSLPWSELLQSKIDGYKWSESRKKAFKAVFVQEQKMRNAGANALTEKLFGFSSGGFEASWANAMISIIYDTHILGDYTPDNSDLLGLQEFDSVVADLINSFRKLDKQRSRELIKMIQTASKSESNVQLRAERVLSVMKKHCPRFFVEAQDGALARRWKKQGLKLKTFYF